MVADVDLVGHAYSAIGTSLLRHVIVRAVAATVAEAPQSHPHTHTAIWCPGAALPVRSSSCRAATMSGSPRCPSSCPSRWLVEAWERRTTV